MVKKELITRSPLRILEKSTHGGVGKGNIGIITARKGVGKTACLVHIATDQLFQGKHVIHVSFAADTSHIVAWYEDIFQEISHRYNLDDAMDVHDEITKNRVIMNFRQGGVSNDQIIRSLRSMIQDGHFQADTIIVDGFDFSKISADEFHPFKEFAEELKIEVWFSATLRKEGQTYDNKGIPTLLSPFSTLVSIIIHLEPNEKHVKLKLIKDHDLSPTTDLHLKLDPQILLIAED
jgi:hypothetical protein